MFNSIKVLVISRISLSNPEYPSRSIGARTIPLFNALSKQHPVVWETSLDDEVNFKNLLNYNFIFFNTHHSDKGVEILKFCKQFSIRVIFDLDDWMFSLPSYSVMRLEERRIENLLYMIKNADIITVSNENLKQRIDPIRNDSHVIPNGLIPQPPINKPNDSNKIVFTSTDNLKLSTFSNNFLRQVSLFFKKFPKITMDFWGDGIPGINTISNIQECGVLPFDQYMSRLNNQTYLFAISPLGGAEDFTDYVYNTSKTCIKYINYAQARIPGIYSNTPPYSNNINNMNTGILVGNDGNEWLEAMCLLMQSDALREKIKANAYKDCFQRYNLNNIANNFYKILSLNLH